MSNVPPRPPTGGWQPGYGQQPGVPGGQPAYGQGPVQQPAYGQGPVQQPGGYAVPRGPVPVAQADVDTRATFIGRVYMHLLMAVGLFVAIEVGLFMSGVADDIADWMLTLPWLVILGAFVIVGMLASRAAYRVESVRGQYLGLFAYVLAEAFIFLPLLVYANEEAPGAIESAAFVTILAFGGLTAIAWFSRKDFSFLGPFVMFGGIVALVAIVAGALFGFQLGLWFMVAIVGLAGASILWSTSRILRQFPEDRYVGASLELFAGVALMFYYILMIFAGGRR